MQLCQLAREGTLFSCQLEFNLCEKSIWKRLTHAKPKNRPDPIKDFHCPIISLNYSGKAYSDEDVKLHSRTNERMKL